MRKNPFLFGTIIFFALAIISAGICSYFATGHQTSLGGPYSNYTGIDTGLSGGAAGFGIIASAFILCGSFFLYKHLTNKNVQ